MSDLKGAIIGYGLAGASFHAPLISSTPGLAVATVVTGHPERREQALREPRTPRGGGARRALGAC